MATIGQPSRAFARRVLRSRALLGVTCAALGALVVGAGAYAAIPDGRNNVIHGCYQKKGGQLRVIDPRKQSCRPTENDLDWNQQGPRGPAGPRGEDGVGPSTTVPDEGGTTTTAVPRPSVGAISPNEGPCAGGQVVEFAGSRLTGASNVAFIVDGQDTSWAFEVLSDSLIRATTAALATGGCVEGDGLGVRGDVFVVGSSGAMSEPHTYDYRTATTPQRADIEAALFERMNTDRAAASSHPPAPLVRDACLDPPAVHAAATYRTTNSPPGTPPDQPAGCSRSIQDHVFGRGLSVDEIVASAEWRAFVVNSTPYNRVGVGVWGNAAGQLWAVVYFA